MYKIILQNTNITETEIVQLLPEFRSFNQTKYRTTILLDHAPTKPDVQNWSSVLHCDVNVLPAGFDPSAVKLVVSDMDSTLINIECIDEIADYAGVKNKVSQVTEAAMRGELDFKASLLARVSLLAGLDTKVLQEVYDKKLKLNPGTEKMLTALRLNKIKFALVSGGFTFFTDKLKARLDIDYTLSNFLEIENNKLTGKVSGQIIDGKAKAEFLLEKCRELNISPSQAVAIGDGANDLLMMTEAGMGIAYHAKPMVQLKADCALNFSGLDGLSGLLDLHGG